MSHLLVIALSSGLGTGLLVGAADKLRVGGPLALLLAYAIVGLMCICTMNSVGELTVAYTELEGGFNDWYRKFLDESVAFAFAWTYYFQWTVAISLELVTAAMIIKFWNTRINSDVFVAVFLVAIVAINFFGVRGYAHAELVMNLAKLLMLTGFVLMGLCIDLGASRSGFIGGLYWHDPGFFVSFKGFVQCFATASFSMGGTEFLALSVSDVRNPRRALPVAIRLVFVRIVFFYLGSLVFVGLLVPYDSLRLLGASALATSASPYVLAASLHGVPVVPHIINAVILNSVMSVATAAMYSLARLLRSLAQQGFAPRWLDYTDRAGRPLRAWLVSVVLSCLSFIATYENQAVVFNWLLSIVALALVYIWSGLCVCHLRWRAALRHQGIPLATLGFVSYTGEWGSYYSLLINFLILIGQFWVALFPGSTPDANSFFQNYLAIPFTLVLYLAHKTYAGTWRTPYIKIADIDLVTGRSVYDADVLALDREEKQQKLLSLRWFAKPFVWFFT
ncbi:hypothetical protein METBIDRAFT_75891 [Metschnikowia bicuspidata var. bicuspidata NRRL YB-4993]|uniref:Amino acid permease/ SLC12A domain-containing protein n=1 Tax=Metschnikowia bicuspidata var. bicuspidata NRRL YB-4993 TaxID=869754 RepID=A0A1A0HFB4_9ASCO|nr:hypothetical protein METBIDRAFT_75891 [Metschnikowia bicuspidata var. bicuspidata NRRL YB-4993]OBA22686.1 hypothetical protein METBIDRAFT_75891 [Metschnikowia bicuspidata var. bicuspidata NRRL YB-4993]